MDHSHPLPALRSKPLLAALPGGRWVQVSGFRFRGSGFRVQAVGETSSAAPDRNPPTVVRAPAPPHTVVLPQSYLTESVDQAVLQNSIPAQIRQIILYVSNDDE